MPEKIISADSHMLVGQETFLRYLPSAQHEVWEATLPWPAPSRPSRSSIPAWPWRRAGRAGEWDSRERLKDMDIDGVNC